MIAWLHGDRIVRHVTTAPGFTPDVTTLARALAGEWEADNGYCLGDVELQCFSLIKGKAEVL